MGVYIKGRDMPNNCQECVCINDEYFYCQAVGRQPQDENVVSRRPNWCPLSDVPTPHGRLIDADALIEDLERQCKEVFRIDAVSPDDYWITRDEAYNEALWKSWVESFGEYLKTRPTIIESEDET